MTTLTEHTDSAIRANVRAAEKLLERGTLGLDAEVEVEERLARVDALVARRDRLAGVVGNIREPDIYTEHGNFSFFKDLVDARGIILQPGSDPGGSLERLLRHQRFTDEQKRDMSATAALGVRTDHEMRAQSTVSGVGGEFTPPVWLLKLFASVSRGVAPLRSLVRSVPLPEYGMSVSIPRFDTAAGVAVQAAQNTAPAQSEATTDSLTAPVVTITGENLMSIQLHDRGPGIDAIVGQDMGEAYAAVLEQQIVNGTGTAGQHLGLLNVPNIETATYTSGSPTVAGIVTAIANGAALVADNRKRPPNVLVMRGARYFWLAGEPDSGGDPVQRVGMGMLPAAEDEGPFGPIVGLPVALDDAIPANLGAGTNQDCVLAVRTSDIILLESDPKVSVVIDGNGLAQELTVAIIWHAYSALFAGRYPSAIAQVVGTGFVTPAGW